VAAVFLDGHKSLSWVVAAAPVLDDEAERRAAFLQAVVLQESELVGAGSEDGGGAYRPRLPG